MAALREICDFLDSLFCGCRFEDDASNNGLQVEGAPEVCTVAFAVDACRATIERAIDAGAGMLVVHHGLSWGGGDGISERRMQAIRNRIRLNYEKLLNSADNEDLLALNSRMSRDISKQIESRLKELAEQVEIPL